MGKSKNFNLGFGTNAKQMSFLKNETNFKIEEIYKLLFLQELCKNGIICNSSDIVFIIKDKSDKTCWLGIGTQDSGLIHIKNRHSNDFKRLFNISENEISSFIYNVIKTKVPIKIMKDKKSGYNNIYEVNCPTHYLKIVISSNGYIITAFPIRKGRIK